MRKSRFSEEQIIALLKRVEAGQPLADVCRDGGISDATYYRWKAQSGKPSMVAWRSVNCGDCGSLRRRTASSSRWSPS